MTPLCRYVSVDPAASATEREGFVRAYLDARKAVDSLFGSTASEAPGAVLCKSGPCAEYFEGPPRRMRVILRGEIAPGGAVVSHRRPTIVMDSANRGVFLHEMVHVEMRARLGSASVPDWFSEGLAVSLSNQRSLEPFAATCASRTPVIDDLRRLDTTWAEYTNRDGQREMVGAYCQAGAEIDAWLAQRGRRGLLALLDAVNRGGAFDEVYGPMLTQSSTKPRPDDATFDRRVILSQATFEATLSGDRSSFAMSSGYYDLANPKKAFSIALWVRPRSNGGTLVHVSSNADGSGWCAPFLGYNEAGQLVSQVLGVSSPSPFAVAVSPRPLPLDAWTHVAMTWAPGSLSRLYVAGSEVASVAAPAYAARGGGSRYLTWGSVNEQGTRCVTGAVRPTGFQGVIREPRVYNVELTSSEVAELSNEHPPG